MKNRLNSAFGLLLGFAFVGSTAFAAFSPVKLDRTHSKVSFTAETLLFDVDGEFTNYSVQIDGNPNKPTSATIKASIDVGSINTQNTKRDGHLKSPDFFDAAAHPKMTFTSTSIKKKGNQLIVGGNLSIRGKTKPVTIPFKVAKGKNGAGAAVTTYKGEVTINRNDFDVGKDSVAAKISLEDDVELQLLIVTFD